MTVNAACRAALQQLREYFASLGDDSPIQSLSLEEGGVAFTVRGRDETATITICWVEADAYPNSGCILFGHDAVSALNERFEYRGELAEVVTQVLRVFGRDVSVPRSSPKLAAVAMEEDGATGSNPNRDVGMAEGSDADWDNVASASEDNDDIGSAGNDDADQGDQESGQEEEEDNDDDDDGDEDDDDERDLIILCSTSLGRWERFEAARTAAAAADSKQALSTTQGVAAKRQIFNPKEAFAMLSRELLDFLKGRHLDCSVETEGDDLYHWIVDLGSFAEGSALAKDMREVSRRYFYSTVRLRLRFMRGLHPFFPPRVEVVWPHLSGPMLGAVASHPMLKLENWDPWRPAMETVAQIKAFLEAHARVDLDNPANDIRLHPTSTYSPLEHGLARLEALSGVPPTCLQQPEIAALYGARDSYDKDAARLQALSEAGKKRGRSEPAGAAKRTREVVWARGTGYGSGHEKSGELWDAKATEAAQRARDSEIQSILEQMLHGITSELGPRPPLPLEEEAGAAAGAAAAAGVATEVAAADAQGAAATAAGVSSSDGPSAMEGVEMASGGGVAGAAADGGTAAAAASAAAAGGEAGPGAAATQDGGGSGSGGVPRLGADRCMEVMRSSCLLPFLVRELRAATFNDMGSRNKYYIALLSLIRELCRAATHELLWLEAGGGQGASSETSTAGRCGSVAAIICTELKSAARIYLSVLGPDSVPAAQLATATAAAAGASTSVSLPATRPPDKAAIAAENAAREAEATARLSRIIMQAAAYLEANAPPPPPTQPGQQEPQQQPQQQQQQAAAGEGLAARDGAAVAADDSMATAAEATAERAASGAQASTSIDPSGGRGGAGSLYVSTMKPLQVDAVPDLRRSHHYANHQRTEQAVTRTRAIRLAREVASLQSLLPLSESSSVFVRVDEGAVQLWKAIVVGPEDTPYSGGCFLFDFYFPPQYPNVPPQVHLMTTGGGRVRFNPNLYAEGKVCLSLLGTWSGDRGESWNPDVSTAVQVLISIQSLIMVPEPYFNEPSYEAQTNERGKQASRDYSKAVRENCVRYAMLDVLRHPPAEFATVVRSHFRLRRAALVRQIQVWADEGKAAGDTAHAARLLDLRRELETLMASL